MTWLTALIAVVVVIVFLTVAGVRPKGGRPVAGSQLMAVGRVVLRLILALVVYAVWRGYSG